MTAIEDSVIYKFDLLKFLRKLRKEARHFYRILSGATIDSVWILKNRGDGYVGEEKLSVSDFLAQYSRFKGKRDEFSLCIKCYYLRDELYILDPDGRLGGASVTRIDVFSFDYKEELTLNAISEEFPHFVAYLCREALLNNMPFLLTDESVKKQYGLKRPDIEKLRNVVDYYNLNVVDELRAEYERLGAIDWVRDLMDDEFVI